MNARVLLAAFASLGLAACNTGGFTSLVETTPSEQQAAERGPVSPLQTKYYASDEDVQEGAKLFRDGAFGLAQERFQRAAERTPTDGVAWMGLAASYDRLRRFDLADRAYAQVLKTAGPSVPLFNNQGYSYLLRGDVVNARAKFVQARDLDPANVTISNNIRLLDGSRRHVRRHAPAYEQ